MIVLVVGTVALWIRTDGARAFTSESARRLAVFRTPRRPPTTLLEASDGARFTLEKFRGRTIIVDFIYTSCPTLCVSLGTTFTRLQAMLVASRRDDVHLLSIGIDVERDVPEALAAYAERHQADPSWWTLARVVEPRDLKSLLSSFGVLVIADSYGGFSHNTALHFVDPEGRLIKILDMNDIEGAAASIAARTDP